MDDSQVTDNDSYPEGGLDFINRVPRIRELATLHDFTILCGTRQWKVHRVVLALHSKVLERACAGDFRGAKEGTLDLSDLDEDVVDALVQYLYTFKFDSGLLSLHVRVAIAADQYDIQALKKTSSDKVQREMRFYSYKSTPQFIEDFPHAARLAYSARPAVKDICKSIVQLCVDIMSSRYPTKDLLASVEAAMTGLPALGLDVARAYAAVSKGNEYKEGMDAFGCSNCESYFAADDVSGDYLWCPSCGTRTESGVHAKAEDGVSVRDIIDKSDWWKD